MVTGNVQQVRGSYLHLISNNALHIKFLSYDIPFTGKNEPNKLTCSQLCNFVAQLVRALHRHRSGHGFESRWFTWIFQVHETKCEDHIFIWLVTLFAFKRILSSVNSFMIFQMFSSRSLKKTFVTLLEFERSLQREFFLLICIVNQYPRTTSTFLSCSESFLLSNSSST